MKSRVVLVISLICLVAASVAILLLRSRLHSTARSESANSVARETRNISTNNNSARPTNPPAIRSASATVPINPYASALREPGRSKRTWDVGFLENLQSVTNGNAIRFELTEGRMASGTVRVTDFRNGELVYVSGELTEPESGKFFFLKPPEGGIAGKAVGVVEFPGSGIAYRIEPTGQNGGPELWQRRLDEVVCHGLPQPLAAQTSTNMMEAPPLRPDAQPQNIPSYNTNRNGVAVVSLQSLPGSKAVLLLDFFGGYTPTWGGVAYVVPAAANNSTIRDLWKRVAEDYMPFNINVTTDVRIYQAAPASSRQRVCFTDTPVTAAGVAYFGSWNWGNDTPCWSVYTTDKNGAEVAAHEAGHTLGLSHMTQEIPSNGTNIHVEYYAGHGSGATGWAPIMGVGYYQPVATWSKGEFIYCSNSQDELNTIVTANNNVTYRVDDTGDTLSAAGFLEIYQDATACAEGVIEGTDDTDAFQFTTTGGQVALRATAVGDWADLAMAVTLADGTDTVIASNNPQATLHASISTNLPAGTYTFRVTGAARNDPLTNGFSDYASLGYYSIAGFVTGGRLSTRMDVTEFSTNGTVVGSVPANTSGDLLNYTIVSGNSNNTFAIDSAGVVSVANNSWLDYNRLATNTMFPVGFELSVNIVDVTNPEFTELNRRVVISVLQSNAAYPIDVTGYNAGIIVPYNATTAAPKATAFDIANNWCFYQAGLFGNSQAGGSSGLQGLPPGGIFTSAFDGATFRFGPYGGTNALMLGRTFPSSGTLTFGVPRSYNSVSVLASSANGGGLGTMIINFTNGTRSPVFTFNDQDWFNVVANVAIKGFGRLRLGQGTLFTEDDGNSNPDLYETTINLAALGLNQPIASITFTNPAIGGNQNSAVFAISGATMSPQVNITKQPFSVTNSVTTTAVTVNVIAMGAPALSYQWFSGSPGSGTPLAGQTNATLQFFPVQTTHAGNYYAVVTNNLSAATSSVATLTVYRAPQIVQQLTPSNAVLLAGQKLILSIGATAALPVTYHWRFNGNTYSVTTSSINTISNIQLANSGSYSVVVSNVFGVVTSSVSTVTVATPGYPYAQSVIAAQPLGYWRLNETNGTVAYDSIAARNGVYTNTQLGQSGYNLIDTHRAARFGVLSSANSYVGGIPIDFSTATNASFSVEAWVNGAAQTTDAGLLTKGTGSGGEQFNLDCGAANHGFRFFVRDSTGAAHLASGSIAPNGQWHHVVGVCNQTNGIIVLYIDGVSNASATITAGSGILTSTNPVSIGSRQGGTTTYNNQFVGLMQDVAIYNYALAPTTIQTHFNAATNRAPTFVSNPFSKPNVNAGQVYSASISTNASDPNGDAIIFAKVSGPTWLTVGSSGALSGTPVDADANTNAFVISARDSMGLSNSATLYVYVNAAPHFSSGSLTKLDVVAGQNYSDSLAGDVSDANPGETLSFGKLSGPGWLGISSSGVLSGMPLSADVGTNSFVVRVTDSGALTDTATVYVAVTAASPIVLAIAPDGTNLVLNWSGGIAPYQLQTTTNLTLWNDFGTPLNGNSTTFAPTGAVMFYRLQGR